jgi:hypothetical protein
MIVPVKNSARLLVVGIGLYYAVLGLVLLSPDAVYSGDIGVKYVQAQSLVRQDFRTLDIYYPGEFLDPERTFFPLRPPFVMTSAGATQAIFPPTSAVVQALAVAVLGYRGLILLSVVSGVAILWATQALVPDVDRRRVVFALGLASPLWFYAVSGWEHAPAVALGTAGFAAAFAGGSRWSALAAGLLVGGGAALRDETILLMPGVLLALWLRDRSWRSLVFAAVGAALALGVAGAVEVLWFQRPAAAHLRHAVHVLQTAFGISDAPNPELPVLAPMTLRERYETVVQYWLLGYGIQFWIAIGAAVYALGLLLRFVFKSSIGILLAVAGACALAWIDLHEVVTAPKWLAGLMRVAPYSLFAFLPPPRAVTGDSRLPLVVVLTSIAYLAIAFAGVDTTGGKSLGPRLLLPLLPLVVASALIRIRAYVSAPSRIDRLIGFAGVALVLMTLVIHVYGTTYAYYHRNRIDARVVEILRASPERLVIADDVFTAQLLLPLYDRKIVLLADSPEAGAALAALLVRERITSAVVVSRHIVHALRLDPLRLESVERHPRMRIDYWRR